MKLHSLKREYDRIHRLISETGNIASLEVRAHWGSYLCVLVAGFLENALRQIFSDYVDKCSNFNVANYARASLRKIQNPKSQRFEEVTRAFNETWGDDLAIFLKDNGRQEAIDSIMSHRHRIAHGLDSDITVVRVSDYLKKSIQVIEFLESKCDP